MIEFNADDQYLISQVERIMAGDVHGAKTMIYYLYLANKFGELDANLIREIMRSYIARRESGEKITMYDLRKGRI